MPDMQWRLGETASERLNELVSEMLGESHAVLEEGEALPLNGYYGCARRGKVGVKDPRYGTRGSS